VISIIMNFDILVKLMCQNLSIIYYHIKIYQNK